jgi:hypothetical protein
MSEHVEQQSTLGRPVLVATMRALVDEPLETVVAIRHRGFLLRLVLVAVLVIVALGFTPLAQADAAVFVCATAILIGAGASAIALLVDARSPLRLRGPSGVLGVSGSTVYVARGSFWNGSAAALTMAFPREPSTVVLGGIGWARRALTVTPPGAGPVRLETPLSTSSGVSAAISALGRPPEAEWRPDPANPDLLRWWDGGELTFITTQRPSP